VSARGWDALWINVHLATIDEATGLADGYGTIRDVFQRAEIADGGDDDGGPEAA
jgi:hypothetical protein